MYVVTTVIWLTFGYMECSLFVWQHNCISVANTWPLSCLLLLGHQNIMTSKYWNVLQDYMWSVKALFQLLDLCGADIASIKSGHDRVCLLSLPCHMRRYRFCRILITFYVVSPVFCLMSLFVIFNQELFVCPAWSDIRTTLQRIVGRTSVLLLIWGCEHDCDCGWQKAAAAKV